MAHFVYPAAIPAQAATAYPAAPTAYVAAAPQAAYATTTPRAGQVYDSYQTAHTTPQYAYTTRTQVAVTPAATYDQGKTYYQAATATPTYTAAEAHYQPAKPVYSATTTYNTTSQRQAPKVVVTAQAPSGGTYVYPAGSTAAVTSYQTYVTTTANTSYSGYDTKLYSVATPYIKQQTNSTGYDAALYSAATSYYQQQQAAKAVGTWGGFKKTAAGQLNVKAKIPPKQTQLHYCDVCKISCAGPQTYREHLEGQKHKKKEAAMKTTSSTAPAGRGTQNQLRCELCDVTCTGTDAYAAHIRGAKHQKVLKLHTKLGKPIPSTDPVVVASTSSATHATPKTTSVMSGSHVPAVRKIPNKPSFAAPAATAPKKILSTPKITFVGGTTLKTTGVKTEEIKVDIPKPEAVVEMKPGELSPVNILGEKDVLPVGHEYIEEVRNEVGKTVSFNCKLCECKFNDPNAKEMHMKGRRHRLQYKKKVDPKLQVEVKPSIRARKVQEEKLRRQSQKEEFWRRREQEERWREEMRMEEDVYWEERRRFEEMEYFEWQRRQGRPGGPMPPPPFGMPGPGPMMRRSESLDDRHVMSKHNSIYPNEAELQAVQNIVSACEKGLKQLSDFLADSIKKEDSSAAPRAVKGVMRVGVLAKGLLLHGDLNVNLVVLCAEKPTRTLLERMADNLPKQFSNLSEKYEVKRCVEEAAIIVTNNKEPPTSCTITMTSTIIRENDKAEGESVSVKDPPDVLDRQKCLDALAALRHAKWFQARANGLQSCVVMIRILRDLCMRVPTWTPLNQWAMELLVEKCVSSGGATLNPGDAIRRIFECIASGIMLPGGPGLLDPCEKEPVDAAGSLTNQEREDITASAQHALRLIAFRQIHKVLGMDSLPLPRYMRQRYNPRKRRRDNSGGDGTDGETTGEKKDKKEGEDSSVMDTGAASTQ